MGCKIVDRAYLRESGISEEVPQSEVAANLRQTIVGVLRVFASSECQRSYQRAVPSISVPGELFCQWADDVYHPGEEVFTAAFDADERATLAEFDAVFRRVSAAAPAMMPLLEAYIASAAGVELAGAAVVAMVSLGVAQEAETDPSNSSEAQFLSG